MESRKAESQERDTARRRFDDLSNAVIAAAIEVHRKLGPGFVENVYEQALRAELKHRGIPFESQKEVLISYKGNTVGRHVLDLVVAGWLVVELKAVASLEQIHVVQVKSYLRAIGSNAGLLLNFGDVILDIKRVVVRFERRVGQAAAV